MGEVVKGPFVTKGPIDPQYLLRQNAELKFNMVMVIGWDAEDNLVVASSTNSDMEMSWLIERAKKHLMERDFD